MNSRKAFTFTMVPVFFASLFLTAPGWAAKKSLIEDPLDEEEITSLSLDARSCYTQALTDIDHVAIDAGLDGLCKAAKLEPNNAHLHIIAAQAHQLRAHDKSGAEAIQMYDKALELIAVPLSNAELPAEIRRRCEQIKAATENEKTKAPNRDVNREAFSEAVRKNLHPDSSSSRPDEKPPIAEKSQITRRLKDVASTKRKRQEEGAEIERSGGVSNEILTLDSPSFTGDPTVKIWMKPGGTIAGNRLWGQVI